ncbi:hypothetical protein C8T65DRAFT_288256 [Cerioporus squamosus]|nr:hypothetical protein C8T65DRAFT_288256 [Cerioporus squamosus]
MMRRRCSFIRWEPIVATDGNLERRTGVGSTYPRWTRTSSSSGRKPRVRSGSETKRLLRKYESKCGIRDDGAVRVPTQELIYAVKATYAAPHTAFYWADVSVHVHVSSMFATASQPHSNPHSRAPVARRCRVQDGATPDNISPQHLRGTHDTILPTRCWKLDYNLAVGVDAQLSRYSVVTAQFRRRRATGNSDPGQLSVAWVLWASTLECWPLAPP